MNEIKADVFEFERTFTLRQELADAFYNIKRILGFTENVEVNSLTEQEVRNRFSSIRGCLALIYSDVEEMVEKTFGVEIEHLSAESSGAGVVSVIKDIMRDVNVDNDKTLPSDISERFKRVTVLATRLERAISDLDEDAGLYERGVNLNVVSSK